MMNLLALGLILSTLTAAGVLTPPVSSPHHPSSHHRSASDPVVHEGHRVIVVEYERQLPPISGAGNTDGSTVDATTTTALPKESARDKICDAFGRCRDRITGAASDVHDAVKGAKDRVSGIFQNGKNTVPDTVRTEMTEDELSEAKEAMKDKLSQASDKAVDEVLDVKESGENKISRAKEAVKNKLFQGKEVTDGKLSEAKGQAKDELSEAEHKFSRFGEDIKDKASELKDEIKESKERAENIAERTAKNLTDFVKRARDAAYDVASNVKNSKTNHAVWGVTQLLGFAMAYGTCVWVTFIASYVLSAALPRQQFGIVQSKLYPVYFRAIAYGIGITLLAQVLRANRESAIEKLQTYNLLGALGMVLVNMLLLEPQATKIMFERMKAEKEEGRGNHDVSDIIEPVSHANTATPNVTGVTSLDASSAIPDVSSLGTGKSTETKKEEMLAKDKLTRLGTELKRWNSYSSLVNVLTLMALTWHLVHLSRLLACNN